MAYVCSQSYQAHCDIPLLTTTQGGSSEEYLASLDWKARGLTMDTKFFPNHFGWMGRPKTHLTPEDMRTGLTESLKALDTEKVDLWYLHGPDRSIPIADTLKAVNELYKEGKFDKWGISNFMAWEGTLNPLHHSHPSNTLSKR